MTRILTKAVLGFLVLSQVSACTSTGQQGALLCGLVGAGIGALADPHHRATGIAIGGLGGAAACGLIGDVVEQHHREALAHERQLDQQIAQRQISIADMRAENRALSDKYAYLVSQANDLRNQRYRDQQAVAQVQSAIVGEQRFARDGIRLADRQIQSFSQMLSNPELGQDVRNQVWAMREVMYERRQTLVGITQIDAGVSA